MSEQASEARPSIEEMTRSNSTYAKIIYILYLVGLVMGLTAIIGVVMAYVKRSEPEMPVWLKTHFDFQIQTFWYGVIYLLVGILLATVFIGAVVLVWWMIWLIIRSVKGLSALDRQTAIEGTFFGFGRDL
ncbi:DUF4870 family protein [Thiomicrospira sp. S5]|nr:hypothetical protein [Thiomicrospira sp. S5]